MANGSPHPRASQRQSALIRSHQSPPFQRLSTGALFAAHKIGQNLARDAPRLHARTLSLLKAGTQAPMAGTPLKRLRREQREADQLATYPTTRRTPLPEPRTEPAPYHPDLIHELLALASQGYSATETAAHWAISEETLQEWGRAHQEMAAALNHARTREKAWWTSRARHAISTDNNRFPAGAWSHVMRARFPEYDDKSGLQVTIDLGALVTIHRNRPEPLGKRGADDDKPLIEGRSIRLDHSPTGEGTGQASLPDADGGPVHQDDADPGRAGG